jgi:hypothetical protein
VRAVGLENAVRATQKTIKVRLREKIEDLLENSLATASDKDPIVDDGHPQVFASFS